MTREFGTPHYTRLDAPATLEQKAKLRMLSPERVKASRLAGLKVVTASGWFAARPSGTENIYKIYAESFQGDDHLNAIVSEAREIADRALETQA